MNRQVFTLMTVFLMLGALWNGAWGTEDEDPNSFIQEIEKDAGYSLDDGQYYLISTDKSSFLKGTKVSINGIEYTTLASSPFTNPENNIDEIEYALWKITNISNGNQISGCYLINKKTGGKLTFSSTGELLTGGEDDPTNFRTQFSWFTDNKYKGKGTNKGASIFIINTEKYITDNGTVDSNSSPFNVYTTKKDDMTAQNLNNRMGDGFILAAKGISKVEETPLLNHKLVALTFQMDDDHAITDLLNQAKNITGYDGSSSTKEKHLSSRTYFIYSGYDNFKKEWGENNETITITDSKITITGDNIENVLKAFKAATFVAVSDNFLLNTEPGLGYTFTTKTGSDLLQSGVTVSYLNAQFDVFFRYSQGSATTVNDLDIQLQHCKFKGESNPISVSPHIMPILGTNYLITVRSSNSQRTSFGFASSGGTVNYSHFHKKAYNITIANKIIKEISNEKLVKAEDLYLLGGTIYPSSSGTGQYKEVTQNGKTTYNYTGNVRFGEPTNFLSDKPEGQWIISRGKVNDENCLLFNNRESGSYFSIKESTQIYKVDSAEDLYYISGGITGEFNGRTIVVDTLRFTTPKQNVKGLDGYAHKESNNAFDPVVLKNTAYRLGIQNGTFDGSVVFVQKSLTHNNTLVVDVKSDEGLYFYLVPCDTVPYGITNGDNGYYGKDDPIDNLKRIQYALQERTSKRYVIYDKTNRRFMLSDDYDDVDKALEEAAKFFFKEKEDDQYILLYCEGEYDEDKKWHDKTKDKMYANIGDAYLHKIDMYTKDIADRFGFYTNESPMYADIMKKIKGNAIGNNDTTLFKINLYSVQNRSGNQKYMLVAGQNNFLAEGIPDTRSDIIINSKAIGGLAYDSIKFSIIVDTAYVRRTPMKFDEYGNPTLDGKPDSSSVMPLYYLGMSSTNKKENVARHDSIPVKPLPDCDKCDYYILNPKVSGNYLFVMTDSIEHGLDNIVKREDHCYHYWNTHHPRLRFVHATHEEDTMIVTSIHRSPKDTLIGGKITTKIEAMKETEWLAPQIYDKNAPNNRPNYGLFAFEVNPNPFDPEVPEYALWNPASKKYIAYVNGNLIMEDQPSYYTLDIKSEGHSIVSNEMVRTSDVRVVAAQGKVIIQNAAGKKVFLQTALGKTLADTVLTSDQEEMAAPAGIVFVTVEGEETVKTIVK